MGQSYFPNEAKVRGCNWAIDGHVNEPISKSVQHLKQCYLSSTFKEQYRERCLCLLAQHSLIALILFSQLFLPDISFQTQLLLQNGLFWSMIYLETQNKVNILHGLCLIDRDWYFLMVLQMQNLCSGKHIYAFKEIQCNHHLHFIHLLIHWYHF